MTIKVRATRRGFYDKLLEAGEEFEIRSKKDLGSWMEEVDGKKGAATASDSSADPFLARNADLIKADLASLSAEQLTAYREQESASEKPRKGVIEAIEQAIAEKSGNP